jgi:choline dehydrogenase-like flavoprotein
MELPVVIVGGGTAGSTVALQLSTQITRPIIVCEPGDISLWDDEPRFFSVLQNQNLVRQEVVNIPRGSVPYFQAHAIGGGSAINGMLLTGEQPAYLDGLTSVPLEHQMGDVSRALLAVGGRACQMWWNNGRWNPGRALVHLIEEGRVSWRKTAVNQIAHTDGRVTGVETEEEFIKTDCVVLTAGAIASPRLLLRSGLNQETSQIGVGVQDHPTVTFSLERTTGNPGVFDAAVVYDMKMSSGAIGLMVAYERQSADDDSTALMTVMLMNPDSHGAITMTEEGLSVNLGLLSTQRDRGAMRELVRTSLALFSASPFQDVSRRIIGGTSGVPVAVIGEYSDQEIDRWIHQEVTPVSHVSSSLSRCVDDRGRIRGLNGVVVADASVLSHVPHETPAAAVTIEARRIGHLLGEELA